MPELAAAFMAGLLGGFGHCMGMCGPVAAAFALYGSGRGASRLAPHLLYNSGRVITYSFIGALMGLGGEFAGSAGSIAGLQNAAMVGAGAMMLFAGLAITFGRSPFKRLEEKGFRLFSSGIRIFGTGTPFLYFPLGLFLGLMPCGLSYSIFIGSAASGGMVQGWALALFFGLGTVPALVLSGVLVSYLGSRARTYIYRLGGASVAFIGLIYVIRGVRLYAQV